MDTKRLLPLLCAVLSTWAGWHLSREGRTAEMAPASQPFLAAPVSSFSNSQRDTDTDSARIAAIIESLVAEHKRDSQFGEFAARLYAEMQNLDSTQFASAIASARSTNSIFGSYAADLLAGLWAEKDLPAARQWLLSLENPEWDSSVKIFETWARQDARGMFDWLLTHSAEITTETVRRTAVFIGSKTAGRLDPEYGFRIIERLAPEDYVPVPIWLLYNNWAQTAPVAAASRVSQEPTESRRTKAAEGVLDKWANSDPAAACAWAEQLPDPILASNALAYIGGIFAITDPQHGADFLTSLPQSDAVRVTLREVLSQWKQRDLAALLGWASHLTDEGAGSWVVQQVTGDVPAEKLKEIIAQLPAQQREVIEARRNKTPSSVAAVPESSH